MVVPPGVVVVAPGVVLLGAMDPVDAGGVVVVVVLDEEAGGVVVDGAGVVVDVVLAGAVLVAGAVVVVVVVSGVSSEHAPSARSAAALTARVSFFMNSIPLCGYCGSITRPKWFGSIRCENWRGASLEKAGLLMFDDLGTPYGKLPE